MSESLKLKNKVAVVTGGNSGIGLAAAREFLAQGAKVVIAGRDEKTLRQAAEELGGETLAVRADVSRLEDIDKLYAQTKERFGRIDVLFANAGIGEFVPAVQVDEATFDRTSDINFKGLFFTLTKAYPLLSEGASVIITSSTVNEKGMFGASVYAATKAAVRSFARTLTTEWAERKIRINTLSPGPILTPIFDRNPDPAATIDAITKNVVAATPLKRFGTSEEMAKVALFLASADSSYITGADIKADGGYGQI